LHLLVAVFGFRAVRWIRKLVRTTKVNSWRNSDCQFSRVLVQNCHRKSPTTSGWLCSFTPYFEVGKQAVATRAAAKENHAGVAKAGSVGSAAFVLSTVTR
jgi:hypothetical protein